MRFINQNVLATYHPVICLLYYVIVLTTTMFTTNPIVRGISLFGALVACLLTIDRNRLVKNIRLAIGVCLVSAISNFLLVHSGKTELFNWSVELFGKAFNYSFTWEALFYGFSFGIMMAAVLLWFQTINEVLSSDKIVFLFGRWAPKIALVISMVMRFIPLFQKQLLTIQSAQKGLGVTVTDNKKQQMLHGKDTFNSLLSWALENAIDTSDSMNARGFGLKNRTNFTIYQFRRRDIWFLSLVIGLMMATLYFINNQTFSFYYYPRLRQMVEPIEGAIGYLTISLLMLVPLLVELKERVKWHYLKSKI